MTETQARASIGPNDLLVMIMFGSHKILVILSYTWYYMLKYLITGINPIPCVSAHTKYTQNFSKYFTKVLLEYFYFNFQYAQKY